MKQNKLLRYVLIATVALIIFAVIGKKTGQPFTFRAK
jgi:hypothetical protein